MIEVSISEFKAKCLALLEQVRKTREPIRVTRHGNRRRSRSSNAGRRQEQMDWLVEGYG